MTINVIDANGITQPINTLPNTGITTAAGGIPVVEVSESTSGAISIANANYATPTTLVPTTNSSVEITTTGYNNLVIQVSGTFSGTMQVQGTADGTNWITLGTSRLHTYVGTSTSSITGVGIFITDVAGLNKVRVTSIATWTSGTANIYLAVTSNNGIPTVLGAIATVSSVTAMTSGNLGIPAPASTTADVASAALTTTTTTAALTPTFGCSYEVNIAVTAVSGTSPTLDVIIQESDDSGTNWFDVYHFERITAIGSYRSPKLPLTGNRIRYVQLVGGTTPSFTRAINRLQSSDSVPAMRRIFDRSMNAVPVATTGTVSIGTGGVLTFVGNTTPIPVGTKIVITGTSGGPGAITNYTTGSEYFVISSTGTGSATIASALGTTLGLTAGALSGLTLTVNELASGFFTTVCPRGNPGANTQLIVSAGALTTAPIFRLQGSDDGVNWYDLSASTLTAVANSTVQLTVANVRSQLARAIITNSPVGVLNYVAVKTFS